MRTRHLLALAGAVALSALVPSSASAATTTFNTEAAFVAAAGPLTTESFEAAFVPSASVPFTGFTAARSGGPLSHDNFAASDGTFALGALSLTSGESFTFTFGAAINSFGINTIDFATIAAGTLQLTTNAGDNLVMATGTGFDPINNVREFGLINDSALFTTVTITFTGGSGEYIAFDELRFGTTAFAPPTGPNGVPLPPAVLMGGIALLAVPLRKRFGKR